MYLSCNFRLFRSKKLAYSRLCFSLRVLSLYTQSNSLVCHFMRLYHILRINDLYIYNSIIHLKNNYMKLTIVIFNAFSQTHTKVFCKNESFKQIADILSNICETFDVQAVWCSEDAEILSCNIINQHKKQTENV